MRYSRRLVIKVNSQVTEALSRHERLSAIGLVNEYPKSGGTWVAKMVASALDIAYIEDALLPVFQPSVIRSHWPPRNRPIPQVHLVRDGRDALVSFFHHRVRRLELDPATNKGHMKRFPEPLQVETIREQLPMFIEIEMTNPAGGSSINWPDFVGRQLELVGREGIVRYEDFLAEPVPTLSKAISVFGQDVSQTRVERAVMLHDRTSAPTSSQASSVLRSGVSGAWQDVFSQEAEDVFMSFAKPMIEELGYG